MLTSNNDRDNIITTESIEKQFTLIEFANKFFEGCKPLDVKFADLCDEAVLNSGTSYPTVQGMK